MHYDNLQVYLGAQPHLIPIYYNGAIHTGSRSDLVYDSFALIYNNLSKSIEVILLTSSTNHLTDIKYSKNTYVVKTGNDLLKLKDMCDPKNVLCLSTLELLGNFFKTDDILSNVRKIRNIILDMCKFPKSLESEELYTGSYNEVIKLKPIKLLELDNGRLNFPCIERLTYRDMYSSNLKTGRLMIKGKETTVSYDRILVSDTVVTFNNINTLLMFDGLIAQYNKKVFARIKFAISKLKFDFKNLMNSFAEVKPFYFLKSSSS